MNAFGEVLAGVLEDRGLDLETLAERADLEAGELREAATDTDPDRVIHPYVLRAVHDALDLPPDPRDTDEARRLWWAYFMNEHYSGA